MSPQRAIQRVALYCRVSTSDQNTAMQAVDLRRMAEARGWEVVTVVEEKVSGRKNRPARERLIQDAKKGLYDGVLVWKLDRWGRSTRDLLNTITDLDESGVAFVSLSDGIDLSTSAGRLLLAVLSAIAEFEADGIRERVTMGLRHAGRDGTRSGRAIGRPRTIDARVTEIRALDHQGVAMAEISRRLKIGYGSVHRVLRGAPERHK